MLPNEKNSSYIWVLLNHAIQFCYLWLLINVHASNIFVVHCSLFYITTAMHGVCTLVQFQNVSLQCMHVVMQLTDFPTLSQKLYTVMQWTLSVNSGPPFMCLWGGQYIVIKLQTTFSHGFLQEPIRKCYQPSSNVLILQNIKILCNSKQAIYS